MIPLYSTEQIRKVDEKAINRLGIPGIVLMENASKEIFQSITNNFEFRSIGFVCGKGNNGGDGFAAARHFANAGYDVKVLSLGNPDEMSADCKTNFSILKKIATSQKNVSISRLKSPGEVAQLKKCDIICDGLLGSGAKGNLRGPYLSIVKKLNGIKSFKVAIDIPTGLDADKGFSKEAFYADLTITLGGYKKGLFFGDGYAYSGEIEKGSIGIPDDLHESLSTKEYLIEPEDALIGLPEKKRNINKYSAGKVLNIAGSESYPGASVLTSKSVFKIGAGASVLAFPKSARTLIQKKLGEVVVTAYDDENSGCLTEESIDELSERIKWADVVTIGPGLGRDIKTQKAVIKFLKERKFKKVVIDADAIFALNKKYQKFNLKNVVFTPHHGEFANLLGIGVNELKKDILKHGYSFVKRTGAYLILKGAPTIIFTPSGEALINSSGNPAMAKFGTGDVLTGTIAGLLAQQKNIEKSVVSAVYLHSFAADLLLSEKTEYSLIASEIMNYLPSTIKFLRKSIV